ncbi:hypothetical protein C8R46DRAFT_1030663 [Mycena filopes]|nr:hypothetical protein C8R46DRAFT_1030663 [Mycena filopes]
MSGRISVDGFPFVGKLVFFPALLAVSSFLFAPVQPLRRDMEAFNDDWNELNDLGHSANKFRPNRSHPTRALGPISCSSALYRDMDAFNDDWNELNDLDYFADTFRLGTPHPTRALGRISVRFPYLPRVFVAFRDMDANDLEKYACRRPCTFVPTTPTSPHSTRILVPLCGPHRLGKIGSAYPYALQSPGPTRPRLSSSRFRVQLIGMSAHEDINSNIHTQLCWVPRSFGHPIFFPVLAPNSSTFLRTPPSARQSMQSKYVHFDEANNFISRGVAHPYRRKTGSTPIKVTSSAELDIEILHFCVRCHRRFRRSTHRRKLTDIGLSNRSSTKKARFNFLEGPDDTRTRGDKSTQSHKNRIGSPKR